MSWYLEIESNVAISQGDIFFNCPIISIDPDSIDLRNLEDAEVDNIIRTANIIVMTQACDLEFDPVENVTVVTFQDVLDIGIKGEEKAQNDNERRNKRWSFVKDVNDGKRPNYHLIGPCNGIYRMNYQIVEFHSMFTISYKILSDFRELHGPRLRLNTPHRELLSQRFGNYFTRIGLPNEDHIVEEDLKKIIKS